MTNRHGKELGIPQFYKRMVMLKRYEVGGQRNYTKENQNLKLKFLLFQKRKSK